MCIRGIRTLSNDTYPLFAEFKPILLPISPILITNWYYTFVKLNSINVVFISSARDTDKLSSLRLRENRRMFIFIIGLGNDYIFKRFSEIETL